ncbi:hypothetical protein D3C78_1426210 [compost metagenome]
MRPDLHPQEQGVEHHHRANGERRIELPVGFGNELGHHHRHAHGSQDHHAVAARRIIVVGLFAMLEPTHQRRQAENAVDVEHDG